MTMNEINEAAKIISEAADPDANIIFGATIKDDLKDELKISVIATGFDESRRRLQGFVSRSNSPFLNQPPHQMVESDDAEPTQPAPKLDDRLQHTEVPIDSDLDIPAFLRGHK